MTDILVLGTILTLVVLIPILGWPRWRRTALLTSVEGQMSEAWRKEHVYQEGVTRGDR